MTSSPSPVHDTVIGLDVGHSAVKVVVDSPALPSRHSFLFPSVVTGALELSDPTARALAGAETVTHEGRAYFFGDTAIAQGTMDSESGLNANWVTSPQYAVLVLGALHKIRQALPALSLSNAILVGGLPAKFFGAHKPLLAEVMRRLAPGAEVLVFPQPMGPFLSIQFTPEGKEDAAHRITEEAWGTIVSGHLTTDFGIIRHGVWIEKNAGSCRGGSAVMEEIVRAIHAQTGRMLSLVEATAAVEKGHFVDYGARVEIAPFLSAAQAVLVDDVVDTAARLLDRDARGLNGIVVAGGSASLIGDALRARFRHALVDANSRLAVAEGFCRLGCALRAGERRRVDRSRQAQAGALAAAATEA